METILMLLQLVQKLKDTMGLNPFYIMETILIEDYGKLPFGADFIIVS